ncbi:myb/SANT-like DNA-binding domain-containing protein 3 [Cardiocondyla obscurior]|uniref:myb/SANT-like DNA-binding domain-containing protein 3 n=1 Tax=Cardiocondyla obscurior TaxID=286306 RepID=UPI0039657AF3
MSSCKEKTETSRSKHYTQMERKVFLQILQKYKNVVEVKRSDATTLKDKDIAWSQICEEYNNFSLVCQKRTLQQLKKLRANLKQSQKDALTKEKQLRLATGGGSLENEAEIDLDILNIAPHLMETASVLFTSNMSEKEIQDKHELTIDIISNSNCINKYIYASSNKMMTPL